MLSEKNGLRRPTDDDIHRIVFGHFNQTTYVREYYESMRYEEANHIARAITGAILRYLDDMVYPPFHTEEEDGE